MEVDSDQLLEEVLVTGYGLVGNWGFWVSAAEQIWERLWSCRHEGKMEYYNSKLGEGRAEVLVYI